jgi:streptogramin lyase
MVAVAITLLTTRRKLEPLMRSARALLAFLVLLGVTLIGVPAATAAPGLEQLPSLPLGSITTPGGAVVTGPDGISYLYTVSTVAAGNALFSVIDTRNGSRKYEVPLPGALGTWAVTATPNGTAYIGSYSSGKAFRWNWGAASVTDLGVPVAGETFIWAATTDGSGRFYGGTSPGGKLFRYDPATGAVRNYGQLVAGEQFVRSLSIAPDGTVYAGIGAHAHVVAVNPETGAKTPLTLPAGLDTNQYAYDVRVAGKYLAVRFAASAGAGELWLYDLDRDVWTQKITGVGSIGMVYDRDQLYVVRGGEVTAVDLCSGQTRVLGRIESTSLLHVVGVVSGRDLLVKANTGGAFWRVNLSSGNVRAFQAALTEQPTAVQSLTTGPDGKIYGSGYLSGGLASYDPATGAVVGRKGVGQMEGMVTIGNKLYLGEYPKALIYEYDPAQPWAPGTNPRKVLDLSGEKQDRPFAMIDAGGVLAVGTVPSSGVLGGTLALYNPATGTSRVMTNIVPTHSIVGLAYRSGVVYATTSVWGGNGIDAVEYDAKLIAVDVATGAVQYTTVPAPGERAISGLTVDGNGRVWGYSTCSLFEFDPVQRKTLRTMKYCEYDWDAVHHVWRDGFLFYDATDGLLYGKAQGKVFKINRTTLASTEVARPISVLTQSPTRDLYMSRESNFYIYRK